jgi:broad specificity phosphatase PhoE
MHTPMRLIITRHGETEENKAGILQGHLPGILTAKGIEQAKKVAARLSNEQIDFVYSSDLKRSADTALEIIRYHPHLTIEYTPDLRERGVGRWEGRTNDDFCNASEADRACVETDEELFARARAFVARITPRHEKDTVLLVGHNRTNRALIAALTSKTHRDIDTIASQHSTSVTIIDIDPTGSYTMSLDNDTSHLVAH